MALCLVFSDLNCFNNSQGSSLLSFGWLKVSKVPKISEICFFDIQSTKKRVKNGHINVLKWLKVVFKQYSGHSGDCFKLFRFILALKLTKTKASEIFGSSSIGPRLKKIEEFLSKVCRPANFSLKNLTK